MAKHAKPATLKWNTCLSHRILIAALDFFCACDCYGLFITCYSDYVLANIFARTVRSANGFTTLGCVGVPVHFAVNSGKRSGQQKTRKFVRRNGSHSAGTSLIDIYYLSACSATQNMLGNRCGRENTETDTQRATDISVPFIRFSSGLYSLDPITHSESWAQRKPKPLVLIMKSKVAAQNVICVKWWSCLRRVAKNVPDLFPTERWNDCNVLSIYPLMAFRFVALICA